MLAVRATKIRSVCEVKLSQEKGKKDMREKRKKKGIVAFPKINTVN